VDIPFVHDIFYIHKDIDITGCEKSKKNFRTHSKSLNTSLSIRKTIIIPTRYINIICVIIRVKILCDCQEKQSDQDTKRKTRCNYAFIRLLQLLLLSNQNRVAVIPTVEIESRVTRIILWRRRLTRTFSQWWKNVARFVTACQKLTAEDSYGFKSRTCYILLYIYRGATTCPLHNILLYLLYYYIKIERVAIVFHTS